MSCSSTTGAWRSRDATACRRQDAFTLLELLVVMGIMGVMVGITAASYVGVTRRASREGARENVMDILRQARVSAVDTGRGAVVRIDPAANGLYGIATDVIGAWHFEEMAAVATLPAPYTSMTSGARRYDSAVGSGVSRAPGKLGLGFHFDGSANATVDCTLDATGNFHDVPVWNQTTGIRLEAWANPDPAGIGSMHIISKIVMPPNPRGYFVGLDHNADGTVTFEAGFAVNGATGGFGNDMVYLQSVPHYGAGQWHSVAAEFDGFQARLYVDGAIAASNFRDGTDGFGGTVGNGAALASWPPSSLMIPARGNHLYIGRGTAPSGDVYFLGDIDEPRVLSIAGGNPVTLPQMVPMLTSNAAVYYDAQGFLNLAYHTQPVYIAVGDPYQQALLSADTGPTIVLAGASPFPLTGGLVMLGNDVIQYTGVAGGNTLTGLTRRYSPPDNNAVYVGAGPPAGHVYFARVVKVEPTGVVEMVTQP